MFAIFWQKLKIERPEDEKHAEEAVSMETEKVADSSAPFENGMAVDSS